MTNGGNAIVCGIDDTRSAPAIARVAAGIAQLFGARLELVHVLGAGADSTAGSAWRSASEAEEAEATLLTRADAWLDELARTVGAPNARRHVLPVGEPGRRLAQLAEEVSAHMIVVAGHGASGALLGSVSSRLAADAPCPVLILTRDQEQYVDLEQWPGQPVVCALDGSELACAAALHAADLAVALRGPLVAVTVDTAPDTACLERLRRRLAGTAAQLTVDRRSGDPANVIERVANAATASLIAIGSRGVAPRTNALLGAVCLGLLRQARRPILVMPATAAR